MSFDVTAAHRGNEILAISLSRWFTHAGRWYVVPPSKSEQAAMTIRACAYVVEALTWVRALDEVYRGRDVSPKHAPYVAALHVRPDVEELLLAARYACNKSIHMLVQLAQFDSHTPTLGPLGAVPFAGTALTARYRWAGAGSLPPDRASNASDQKQRAAYMNIMAEKGVSPALHALNDWLASYP
jgi:hypothetical protein